MIPDNIRELDDTKSIRNSIYDGTITTLQNKFPITDGVHRLELTDLKYVGEKDFSLTKQKKALLSGSSLRTGLSGTWSLYDQQTNKLLDTQKNVNVMSVPYLSNRGTFINKGNDYAPVMQSRLKSGVFTRTKKSGEHEAHFNVESGTGKGFRIWMEPSTGIFRVNVGQANIPAYQFLNTLGVTDKDMQDNWGEQIYNINKAKSDPKALNKLYTSFLGRKAKQDAEPETKIEELRTIVMSSVIDDKVVNRTLGLNNANRINDKVLLRTTQKLLNVARGEEQEDDRDEGEFGKIMSAEDLFLERISKDAGGAAKELLRKVRRDKTLKYVGKGALNSYVDSYMLNSGLVNPIEETNPIAIYEQLNRIVKLGEGGLPSAEAVTDEAREVKPGQVGFIDLVAGPESDKIGIDTRAAYKTFKGKDNQLYGEFLNSAGKKVYLKPEDLVGKTLAFPGQKANSDDVICVRNGKVVTVDKGEVDYQVPSLSHMNNIGVNLVPMSTGMMPSRSFYSSKYWTQYLPLKKGEAPLVQTLTPDGKDETFNDYYGKKLGAVHSEYEGKITKITDEGITVTDKDGAKHFVETVKNFPYNRMTSISYFPSVKVGDEVTKGSLIAHSNFTDEKGTLATGVNLKTAVVPYKGFSVSGDTRILWFDMNGKGHFTRIADMDREGTSATGLDTDTITPVLHKVHSYIEHAATAKMARITTRHGHIAKATYGHSFVVVNQETGELQSVQTENIEVTRDIVPIIPLPVPYCDEPKELALHGYETVADFTFGRFVGIYIACGGTLPDGTVVISTDDLAVKAFVKMFCIKEDIECHNLADAETLVIGHAGLARFLTNECGIHHSDKKIPDLLWTGHKSFAQGIISGVFSSLASIAGGICLSLTNENLAEQLSGVLSSLMIRSSVACFTNGFTPRYQLNVILSDTPNLPMPQLINGDKQEKLVNLLSKERRFATDRVPVPNKYKKELYRIDRNLVQTTCFVGREKLRKYYGQLPTQIQEIIDAPIWWDVIDNVDETGVEPIVYDLDMRPIKNFSISNGFIVHNSFEDAYVISESAAKKLTTERLYGYDKDVKGGIKLHKNKYTSAFPKQFNKEQLANIGDNGVVKAGTIVRKGDPLILGIGPRLLSAADAQIGNLHKTLRNTHKDESVIWDHDHEGVVTDVAMTAAGARLNVKSAAPAEVGNKLANLFASKGIIGKVVPEDEMPYDEATGEKYEMLFNPMAVLSRVAPNQLIELQLGKIAKKTGKPYKLSAEPPEGGWKKFAESELAKHGMGAAANILDPITGKKINSIGDGYMYINSFHHLAEKKLCVTTDTEVLTDSGWKTVDALTLADKVYTLDHVTGTEKFDTVTAINNYSVNNDTMYHIEDEQQDLLVTPDHRVYLHNDNTLKLAKDLHNENTVPTK